MGRLTCLQVVITAIGLELGRDQVLLSICSSINQLFVTTQTLLSLGHPGGTSKIHYCFVSCFQVNIFLSFFPIFRLLL